MGGTLWATRKNRQAGPLRLVLYGLDPRGNPKTANTWGQLVIQVTGTTNKARTLWVGVYGQPPESQQVGRPIPEPYVQGPMSDHWKPNVWGATKARTFVGGTRWPTTKMPKHRGKEG